MDTHIPIFTMDVLEMKKKIAEANELTKDNEELKKQLEERDLRIKELEELQNRNENELQSKMRQVIYLISYS